MNPDRMRDAYRAALRSPDPSTQVGVVITNGNTDRVVARGANDLVSGMAATPENLLRPRKYAVVEHAERNAIYTMAYFGIEMPTGAILYATYAACAECARAIIGVGIDTVVRHAPLRQHFAPRWAESLDIADEMLRAADVNVIDLDPAPIDLWGLTPIRVNGQLWDPQHRTLTPLEDQ